MGAAGSRRSPRVKAPTLRGWGKAGLALGTCCKAGVALSVIDNPGWSPVPLRVYC